MRYYGPISSPTYRNMGWKSWMKATSQYDCMGEVWPPKWDGPGLARVRPSDCAGRSAGYSATYMPDVLERLTYPASHDRALGGQPGEILTISRHHASTDLGPK